LAGLSFKPEDVQSEYRHLITPAIEKASTHPDTYLRERLQIQLGVSKGPYRSVTDH
jgi:hypothetical protein